MSSNFKYTNPDGYKYIEGWITADNHKVFIFRINLPWTLVTWYINDVEVNKICSLINSAKTKHQNLINEEKSLATTQL